MTKEELEKERFIKSYPEFCCNGNPLSPYWDLWQAGTEFGYQKAMKEWRDCFMSCSSPYCADKFRDIQCGGMLGNMTKEVRDGSNREKGI